MRTKRHVKPNPIPAKYYLRKGIGMTCVLQMTEIFDEMGMKHNLLYDDNIYTGNQTWIKCK